MHVSNELLGVPMDRRCFSELVGTCLAAMEARVERFSMACANPHSLSVALRDAEFRAALRSATAVVVDGIGCKIGAVLAGVTFGPRITGFDFFWVLMTALENRGGGRVFFFGSSDPVLAKVRERRLRDFPSLTVTVLAPPYGDWSSGENERVVEHINTWCPDVLWVAMTGPRQEKWVGANFRRLAVPSIGRVGAVFDYYAGTVQRAPRCICDLGLEWLYRLAGEPRRLWRRTVVSAPDFLWASLRQRFEPGGAAKIADG